MSDWYRSYCGLARLCMMSRLEEEVGEDGLVWCGARGERDCTVNRKGGEHGTAET